MGTSKFLERDSFRELPLPVDEVGADVMIGTVLVLDGERWRVVGSAPNPNRPGDRLVFVERVVRPSDE